MADKPAPKADPKADPKAAAHAAAHPLTPEAEVSARIKDLQAQILSFQKDVKTIEGRVANRSPEALKSIQKENQELRARLAELEKALFAMILDGYKPRNSAEEKLRLDLLRHVAAEYCKKANVDPEIWKSLVS